MLALSSGSSQFLCNIENWVELGDKASTHLHIVLYNKLHVLHVCVSELRLSINKNPPADTV